MRSPMTAISRPVLSALALAVFARLAAAATPAGAPDGDALKSSVVAIHITGQEWNWRTPWAKQVPWNRVVTGLVVPGARVADSERPLALLEVDDAAFWTGLVPLELAATVPVSGEVKVHRWLVSGQ